MSVEACPALLLSGGIESSREGHVLSTSTKHRTLSRESAGKQSRLMEFMLGMIMTFMLD